MKFLLPPADTLGMDTDLRPAPARPAAPAALPVTDPVARADEFVAWAAEIDDATWRSLRIRVENLRFLRRREAVDPR